MDKNCTIMSDGITPILSAENPRIMANIPKNRLPANEFSESIVARFS